MDLQTSRMRRRWSITSFMCTRRQEISSKILDLMQYVNKRREALEIAKVLTAFNNLTNYGTQIWKLNETNGIQQAPTLLTISDVQFIVDRVGYALGKLAYWLEYPIDSRYEMSQLSLRAEEMRSLDLDHNKREYSLGLGMNYFKGILNNMLRQAGTTSGLQEWLQQAYLQQRYRFRIHQQIFNHQQCI